MSEVLRLENVTVTYGDLVAVDGVDLTVDGPGLLALVGPSGCGKTSLLRAIAGFESPARGRISIGGDCVADGATWVPPERRHVGLVFQEGALFPHLDVLDNVRFGLRKRADADLRAREVLALVGLEDHGGRYPDQLSGGQQQRVALARALAPSPPLILLDEPFANLDASLRVRVRDEVREILRRAQAAAVIVTHDQEEALSMADRVGVMIDGRLHQVGPPIEVYDRPASPSVAEFIGDGVIVPCEIGDGTLITPFGSVECTEPDGPARVLVRPEDLEVAPQDGGADGRSGRLLRRRFFGHDLVDEIQLESGPLVRIRSLAPTALAAGSMVRVSLRRKAYRVFRDES